MKKMSTDLVIFLVLLIGGLSLIGHGIIMIIEGSTVFGNHYLTTQYTAHGGEYFIAIGSLFAVLSYFTLSPFSKIRKYFEGETRHKKKKKRK